MPNWCYQKLSVSGKAEDVAAFNAVYLNEKKALELNRAIPMPPELDVEEGSDGADGYDALCGDWQKLLTHPTYRGNAIPDEVKTSREACVKWMESCNPRAIEIGKQYQSNLSNHGYRSWWTWRIANWGTKWEIGESQQSILSDEPSFFQMTLETAWSPIFPALEKMVGDFPELTFELWYLDDGGGFAGVFSNSDGCLGDTELDWRETAAEQFGWEFEEEDAA